MLPQHQLIEDSSGTASIEAKKQNDVRAGAVGPISRKAGTHRRAIPAWRPVSAAPVLTIELIAEISARQYQ